MAWGHAQWPLPWPSKPSMHMDKSCDLNILIKYGKN